MMMMAGGNGDDILDGGNGADTLYGGQGKIDSFERKKKSNKAPLPSIATRDSHGPCHCVQWLLENQEATP